MRQLLALACSYQDLEEPGLAADQVLVMCTQFPVCYPTLQPKRVDNRKSSLQNIPIQKNLKGNKKITIFKLTFV